VRTIQRQGLRGCATRTSSRGAATSATHSRHSEIGESEKSSGETTLSSSDGKPLSDADHTSPSDSMPTHVWTSRGLRSSVPGESAGSESPLTGTCWASGKPRWSPLKLHVLAALD
jgi:hypothetical protein